MKLTGKEVLAWMILLLSILFFSATVAYAGDGKPQKRHICMVKTVNGKTFSIDTTFTATDSEAEKVMEDINNRFGMDHESTTMIIRDKKGKDKKKEKVVVISVPHMSEADHQKLKSDIEKALDDMEKSFEEMGRAFEDFDFNFNFNTDDDSVCINMNFPDFRIKKNKMVVPGDLPDSLTGDDRVIIEAEEGEHPPVFEKSVKGESGKNYFIYKRDQSSSSKPVLDLSVFPNPSSGKFNVKLFNQEKSDVLIRVVNESGKEVYRQLVESLKGDHSFEVDLGSRAKGKYLITATAGTRQLTRKLIVE